MNNLFESKKSQILAVIFTGAIMIALDGSTVSPILYPLKTAFGVSEGLISWAINIEVLFLLIFTPIIAKMADYIGRKKIYLLCISSFIAGLLIVVSAQSFEWFLAGRALQGIGAGISVLAIVLIGDHFTENRGTVLGIFGVIISMVYAAGPLIAGFLINFDWHFVFAVNIPVALVLACLAYKLLPAESDFSGKKAIDWKGIIALSLAIAAFAIFITQFSGSLFSAGAFILIAVTIVSLLLFLKFERSTEEKILPLSMLKRKNPLIASILTLLGYTAGAGTYFLSTFAIMAFGLSDSAGAYILLPFTVASLVATLAVGKLLDKTGPKPIMLAGGLISATGMFILGISGSIHTFILSTILIGIGNASIAGNALYYLMLHESGTEDRASAQGLLNVLLNAGSLIGGALLGAAFDSASGGTANYRITYFVLASVYIGLAIIVTRLKQD
ncbi:major facilitator superfamily MFS_1 [Methanolacinia petrolearia DSM 11571]|uniref:Major facilitator superfamily MFS_1 n=1 Tax=Methanolacinia petrolearia (strain DSM 11571 / OCM 486 / SEBR 4847) TaxID=679926 RepID=E1RDW4_METP4|nr:MFS transporter [Methanolacinia petrolearia]ADN37151.1 major facilitator superfamily MFS_1 [Methanolacinia petrolearia DSM 11571]